MSENGSPAREDDNQSNNPDFDQGPRDDAISNAEESKRVIYVGQLPHNFNDSDLRQLFEKYGPVHNMDLKLGFAFVTMDKGAEDAVQALNKFEFLNRPLRVEFAKGNGIVKRREEDRKVSSNKPSRVLFVVNYDSHKTRQKDLERVFSAYGKVTRVEMSKTYAFIEFEDQESAVKAREGLNRNQIEGRTVTVEFSVGNRDKYRGDHRDYDRPPRYGSYRSIDRGSDYGDRYRDDFRSRYDRDRPRSPPRDRLSPLRMRSSPLRSPRRRSPMRRRSPSPRRRSPMRGRSPLGGRNHLRDRSPIRGRSPYGVRSPRGLSPRRTRSPIRTRSRSRSRGRYESRRLSPLRNVRLRSPRDRSPPPRISPSRRSPRGLRSPPDSRLRSPRDMRPRNR